MLLPGCARNSRSTWSLPTGKTPPAARALRSTPPLKSWPPASTSSPPGTTFGTRRKSPSLLQTEARLLRPFNYPPGVVGQGSTVWWSDGQPPVAVLNLQGRTFMPPLENPFLCARAEVPGCARCQDHLCGHARRSHFGKNRPGPDARRPGQRRHRHPHPRPDGGRADFPGRDSLFDRRRFHRPA
jgi:hypothetical protein